MSGAVQDGHAFGQQQGHALQLLGSHAAHLFLARVLARGEDLALAGDTLN
ncbi:hypothetical protein [Streptomyces sp. Agncl-13]